MRIVMFSGGVASWAAAKRVADQHGTADLILLFADTLIEDEDTYRFVQAAADNVGGQLAWIKEGRDPWQVFFDKRYLGNTRIDPCSEILKRNFMRAWLESHTTPAEATIYLGLDWTEGDRFSRATPRWEPWHVEAPMSQPPYLSKDEMLDWARREGLPEQRLYQMGMPHANCGGFCIKAGQGHFAKLLKNLPERYAYHEQREQELRQFLNKDVAILRDRTGGATRPLTLREFRHRVEIGGKFDADDLGGCGCVVP
jgi:hypothetical protein